jgi:hypothetical protein
LGRLIGGAWRFKRALDAGDLCFNVWGDAIDDDERVGFELSKKVDPGATWREAYFYNMGEVFDETVDPLRYAAILMRSPPGPTPSPPDASAILRA